MPYLVVISFSVSNDISDDFGGRIEFVIDFGTEKNFEAYESDSFSYMIHVISDRLSSGYYVGDDYPQLVWFIGTEYTDEIDPEDVVIAPFIKGMDYYSDEDDDYD